MQSIDLANEATFHDQWAEGTELSAVKVDEAFNSPTCPENIFILSELGDVRGLTILELGTGRGEGATYFAKLGACMHVTDLSLGMVEFAKRMGEHHSVSFAGASMDGAKLACRSGAYDVIYAANTLHHVNIQQCLREVHRVLKPGGRAAFWDPIRYNPVINFYRQMANQVRTKDEHPLGRAELATMQSMFSEVKVSFFGLATLAVFLKFYFVDMIHPNEERYWKKIICDHQSFQGWYNVLRGIDRVLLTLPGVRWLAWNMAVVLTK